MSASYEYYRRDKMAEGQRFQDFIMERAARLGMILNPYCSKEGQRLGENLLGMEIKRDGLMRKYGNLYIEVAEKARPRSGDYAPSGIMRSDNSWLYGIGDELQFWIFSISALRRCYIKRKDWGFEEKQIDTSKGFVIPVVRANTFCARRIDFDFDGNIKAVWNGEEHCEVDLSDPASALENQFQFHLKVT